MFGAIVGLIIVGLIGGYAARALIPGRQALTLSQTLLLGIAGSFVGGALSWRVFDTDGGFVQAASWLGSIVGATILLGLRVMVEDHRQTSMRHR